ncbi:hypothetical protein, partial [Chryseobacterium sp. SIMBA_029]
HILNSIMLLLKRIPLLKAVDKPVTALLKGTGLEDNEAWKKRIWYERKMLVTSGFVHMAKLFDLLVRL